MGYTGSLGPQLSFGLRAFLAVGRFGVRVRPAAPTIYRLLSGDPCARFRSLWFEFLLPCYVDSRTTSFGLIVTTRRSSGSGPLRIISSTISTMALAAILCCRSIVVSAGSVQSAK